jgi:hypothetical protein
VVMFSVGSTYEKMRVDADNKLMPTTKQVNERSLCVQ